MSQVNVITVKSPSELKKKMKQIKVNWSEYIRDSIQNKMQNEIANLNQSLNTAKTAAFVGIAMRIVGIALAVGVTMRKHTKNQPAIPSTTS
jgi:post-segregation antitoxin (ccd killing protein)